MKSSGIGGQAVLEGVMMRNRSKYAVAVRKPDGEIVVDTKTCKCDDDRMVFFRLPLIRGVVAFWDSMVLGLKTLTYSAEFYEEEEADSNKKDQKKSERRESVESVLTIILSVILAIAFFMVLPFGLSVLLRGVIHSDVLLTLLEGLFRISLFVGYVYVISFMQDIRRVYMYHGAEHKTINCIEKGLELNVMNVKKMSREHRRCGTSFLFIVMFISVIFFMFLHFENMWLRLLSRIILVPVIAGISYEFIRFAGNSDSKLVASLSRPGMWLQHMTTREPDESMIEVAIASVEAVFDWREYQNRMSAVNESLKRRGERTDKSEENKKSDKKTRAQQAKELREREEENAKRASERARQIKERELLDAQRARKADEAAKRHAKREEEAKAAKAEQEAREQLAKDSEAALDALDFFFDEETSDGIVKPSVDEAETSDAIVSSSVEEADTSDAIVDSVAEGTETGEDADTTSKENS